MAIFSGSVFSADFQTSEDFVTVFENTVEVDRNIPYEGEYEYTPTQSEQIIEIQGKKALENIVIHPIPSNYGLITWNGSILTVS